MRVGRSELIRRLSDRSRKPLTDNDIRLLIDSLWRDALALYAEKIKPGYQRPIATGDNSVAIGEGTTANSFREIVLGSYAKNTEAISATEWNVLDLLFAMGNGTDDADNRSNALEIYKSGLVKLFNAIKLDKYEHGEEIPEDGVLQFDEQKLQLWLDGIWNTILTDAPADTKPYGRKDGAWVEVAALDHDHEIGNQVLIFENALV